MSTPHPIHTKKPPVKRRATVAWRPEGRFRRLKQFKLLFNLDHR